MRKYFHAYLEVFFTTYFLIMIFALLVGKPPNADLDNEPITNLVMRNWWEIWAAIALVGSAISGLLGLVNKFFITIHLNNR